MNDLVGTRQLTRLALRRDRIVLPIWVVILGVLPASTMGLYDSLYPDAAARASLTRTMGANPSLSLLYGPAFDLSTAAGFVVWRYGSFIALVLAFVCVFTVTRHTRQEEDTGRQELLSSAVTGRFAGLTAGLTTAGLAATVTGLITAVGLSAGGAPAAGSIAFGLGIALAGWFFSAVAAVAAQLATYARTANGLASAVVGAAFLLRAIGDAATDLHWLSWLSPIGWVSQVRPFAGERWWVLLLLFAATIACAGLAYALLPRRDIGMGIIPARPGPAVAAAGLRSSFGLAWRLHRGLLSGWLAGFAVMGALFGSMAAGIGDVVGDSPQAKEMFERLGGASAMVDAFLAAIVSIFGMIAAMYGVQATLRIRAEETAVRLEPLLVTRVRRLELLGSHLVFSLAGSALLLVVGGTAAGLLHGLRVSDVSGQLPAVLGAALAQLPAVWVVVGLSVLIVGLVPRYAMAGWSVASLSLALALYGPVLQLPQIVLDISPFTHIPKLPSAHFTATPLLWLTGIALVALAAGMAGFRRRDIG
ncbi:ABC transporter permease [Amycolatopsis sp. K13G38]|uniref:ABC transporter permease n=1 Tax=Amycolatopsis acididurans TaxID=2724524 RepID=A0ABX1J557_9PSEU|nr:ABC transporter permease [Amycolatopsis acididurans]NKQ54945.1 ABC transporter permease [Amycolatopsis acididurans]